MLTTIVLLALAQTPSAAYTAGQQFMPQLDKAYADSFAAAGQSIAAGGSVAASITARQQAFTTAREAAFAAGPAAVFSAILPAGKEPPDAATRAAFAQAHADFAAGLVGAPPAPAPPAPPTPPPPPDINTIAKAVSGLQADMALVKAKLNITAGDPMPPVCQGCADCPLGAQCRTPGECGLQGCGTCAAKATPRMWMMKDVTGVDCYDWSAALVRARVARRNAEYAARQTVLQQPVYYQQSPPAMFQSFGAGFGAGLLSGGSCAGGSCGVGFR